MTIPATPPDEQAAIMSKAETAATVRGLLEHGNGQQEAIAAPGRPPLTFDRLRRHLDDIAAVLAGFGIGRNDAVAIVCGNGPDAASSFLAVACAATAAPLNPAYRADELHFYLTDLGVSAVIVEEGLSTPAR